MTGGLTTGVTGARMGGLYLRQGRFHSLAFLGNSVLSTSIVLPRERAPEFGSGKYVLWLSHAGADALVEAFVILFRRKNRSEFTQTREPAKPAGYRNSGIRKNGPMNILIRS